MDSDPPFHEAYKTLFDKTIEKKITPKNEQVVMVEECELPLIDLSRLDHGDEGEREGCKLEIARASQEWGFFQVVNHGIACEILEEMRFMQERVFKQPFDIKTKEDEYLNFSAGSYRWGTPTATCLRQLSWSEAFHIPLLDISTSPPAGFDSLRYNNNFFFLINQNTLVFAYALSLSLPFHFFFFSLFLSIK